MKNNKKLVVIAGAAVLGLVAATGVTSGFAWFAVNSEVSAASLNVSAKSNAVYLLINDENDFTGAPADLKDITLDDPTSTAVYPVAYTLSEISDSKGTVVANNWYTATINDRTQATGTYTYISTVTNWDSDYFVHYEVYLRLTAGSKPVTNGTLTVTPSFTKADQSVKIALVKDSASAFDILAQSASAATSNKPAELLEKSYSDFAIDDVTPVKFDMYVYIDGTTSTVFSNSTATLSGEISLAFALA